jgi:hypothetical protein
VSEEIRAFEKLIGGLGNLRGELAQALYVVFQESIDEMAAEIRRGTQGFSVPPRDPKRVAEMLMTVLYGRHTIHRFAGEVTPEQAQIFADHAVDVIFAGRSAW